MAKKAGRLVKVAYSTNLVTPVWTSINGIVDATLNLEQGEIEVTTHDDGGWQAFIAGRKNATLDISMRYDDDDASQDGLRASYFDGTTLKWRFRTDEMSGAQEFTANGFITAMTPAGPNDDAAGFDVTVRLGGAVAMADQA